MYIRAIYLSNICNAASRVVYPHYWDGNCKCITNYKWPRMENPTKNEWQEWQRIVTLALQLGRNRQLAIPLSKLSKTFKQQDGYFIEPTGDHLYKLKANQWHIFM